MGSMIFRTVAAVGLIVLGGTAVEAGFTNNSNNGTFVVELGSASGEFRVNALNESGQMKTAANSAISRTNPDSYSQSISGNFTAYWVSTADYGSGPDFDIVFDSPVAGVVASNALAWGGSALGIDLMSAFTAETSIPSFAGDNFLAMEILRSVGDDNITVNGNQVTGTASNPNPLVENFIVLTAAGSSFATPEPGTVAVWAMMGLIAGGVGSRRLARRRKMA